MNSYQPLDVAPLRCHYSLVEKLKPHHSLTAFKGAFSTPEALRATVTATRSAQALGFTPAGVVEVIQGMKRADFYKSMTALADHMSWQDVYHVPWQGRVLYVNFTDDALTEFRLLSFKEK